MNRMAIDDAVNENYVEKYGRIERPHCLSYDKLQYRFKSGNQYYCSTIETECPYAKQNDSNAIIYCKVKQDE